MHSDSNKLEIHKKISTASTPSLSSIDYQSKIQMSPSTSGLSMSSRNNLKQVMPNVPSCSKISTNPKAIAKKMPPPFKKAQSQSHIQVKSTSNQSNAHITVEHEKKKLKKSRSFDKLVDQRHTIESKKTKTKH